MANSVKEALVQEMAVRTDELATLKVEHAMVQAEKEEGVLRSRKQDEKSRRLRQHMTWLEVQLAEASNAHADADEEKTMAFKGLLESQEERIRELEVLLAKEKESGGKERRGWPF